MYYTYMLRCKDNSIYTGMTNDIKRRLEEHMKKTDKCAKYTISHDVVKLETAWETESRADAAKLEYFLKHLKKQQKEDLISGKIILKEIFPDKIDYEIYNKLDIWREGKETNETQ